MSVETLPVVTQDSNTLMAVISKVASDPNADVGKMERLLGMYERLKAKDAETQFNDALNAAQSEMGRISADASNTQTHSKYASYAGLDKALRPIYTAHGFALTFGTDPNSATAVIHHPADPTDEKSKPTITTFQHVICDVTHVGGHTKRYSMMVPADGKGAKGGDVMTKTHAAGAAMSYGMRYLLKAIFNVAIGEDDDDGNSGEALPNVWKSKETRTHYSLELQRAWGRGDEVGFMQFWRELDADQQASVWSDFKNPAQRKEMTDIIRNNGGSKK